MKCPEPIFDKRSNKTRICGAEIYGLTGLQELQAFQRHLAKKHKQGLSFMDTLEYRAESGQ
jgi:hypothetical protein